MDFKEFRNSKRSQKKQIIDTKKDIDVILENIDLELNIENKQIPNYIEPVKLVEEFKPKFLGKLYESPNPMEYPEGTMYKNTRNGVVYIKEGDSWEYLVEDGKPGTQGKQGVAGATGSGVGVAEVQNIVNSMTISAVANASNTGTQITYDPIQKLNVLDPRKNKNVECFLSRGNGTSAIDLTNATELLVIATNSTSATNSVNALLFDSLISQVVMTSGSALSTSARSFPHLTNKYINIQTSTNSTALSVIIGE